MKMLMGKKRVRGCVRNVFSFLYCHLTFNSEKLFSLFYHICAGSILNRGPQENLNINVRLKLHPIASAGSEPTRIINVPEVSFKQLCTTKINLLLGKLPVSLIPHYPQPSHPGKVK